MRYVGSRWIGFTLFLFSLLILPAMAFANDYYVATTGSDSNNGTQSSPWKTIGHAISSFSLGSNGAVIHVAAGNYTAPSDISRGGSSSTARLVLQCDPGAGSALAAKGQCTVTSSSGGNYGFIIDTANYFDLVGFDIGNNANMTVAVDISCPSSGGSGQACPTGIDSIHVIGNYIHDFGSNVNANGNGLGCLDAGAISTASQSYKAPDAQILRNFIKTVGTGVPQTGGNCNWGIDLTGSGEIVENNIIIGTQTGGIGSHGSCNLVWSNNVVIRTTLAYVQNTQLAGAVCGQSGGVPGHNTLENNYSADILTAHYFQSGTASDCTASTPTLLTHNIWDGSGTLFQPARISCDTVSPATFTSQAGSSFFVNYQTNGSGNYQLASGSAGVSAGGTQCVSGGTSPCTPTTDFAGVVRSASLSVGAYEPSSLLTPPTGLTAQVQ